MPAIELGCPYYIYAPDQVHYAALNVSSDANFVGYVSDVTGLDDAGVRENAQVNAAGDGGYHGPFWRDRRPWTISGIIQPTTPLIARDNAQELLQKIMNMCMRQSGYLFWIPADGVEKFMVFRKQQSTRITTGQSNVVKNFQIAGVSADWRVYAAGTAKSVISPTGAAPQVTPAAVNLGNADAPFKATVTPSGSLTSPGLINLTTNKSIVLTGYSTSNPVVFDLTQQYPAVYDAVTLQDLGGLIDYYNTDWTVAVAPGSQTFALAASGSGSLQVQWNDAWV